MTAEARTLARAAIRKAVSERVTELTDAWLAADTTEEREELHSKARATIELEELLDARLAKP